MKITVVAPTQIPARRANTIQVMKMAHAMVVLGHQIVLLSPLEFPNRTRSGSWNQPGVSKLPHIWSELSSHYGIEHEFPIEWIPCRPSLRRYDYSFRAYRHARRWNADLLYTRLPQAAAIAGLFNMDTILEMHDIPRGTVGPRLFHLFLRSKGARGLVVITQALADDLELLSGTKLMQPFLKIAPDGIDLRRYEKLPNPADARRELLHNRLVGIPLEAGRFTAGYTGHLYHGRGINTILEIASRVLDVTFLLVGGESEEVRRLKQEIESREIKNVIATGFVANAELPLFQAACDVLLMPYQQRVAASSGGDISRYLSPMKLFEYMACGRVILTSDLPVLQEVLNQGNSVILPSDDIDAWVSGLEKVRIDPQLCERLSQQSRADANLYTWEGRVERILRGLEYENIPAA